MKTVDLKSFRKANDLNQSDVAKFLGVTKSFISRVEKGKERLPEKQLQRLLEAEMPWNKTSLEKEVDIPEEPEVDSFEPKPGHESMIETQQRIILSQQETIERLTRIVEKLTASEKREGAARIA